MAEEEPQQPPPLFENVSIRSEDDQEYEDDDLFASAVQVPLSAKSIRPP